VSRRHFAIKHDGLAFLIRDMGSTNGTFVNDVRIKEVYLQHGSRILAGKVSFRFEIVRTSSGLTRLPDPRVACGRAARWAAGYSW